MTCPVEKKLALLLDAADIEFTKPERDQHDPTTLDFYLPSFDIYIEVKQFHTPRIADQLSRVPTGKTAIVLQGKNSATDFEKLCARLAQR